MIEGAIAGIGGVKGLGGDLPGNFHFGIQGPPGPGGSDGGFYIPEVNQIEEQKMEIRFTPSKDDMPPVNPVQINLPVGECDGNHSGNVDLSGYLQKTELIEAVNDALAQAKASGEFDGKDGKDGADGQPGKDGEPGKDGAPGADGDDYVLTSADKAEIANEVISLLPTWTGGSY